MTVYARGIDYAWTHPDPKAIKEAGYDFACRYLSRDPSKNLALAEAQALAERGIWCVANWEYGAQDALRGFAGGVADATLALQQATAAGMPPGRPIYFSVDWDVTPAQEASVTAYLQGADSVLGLAHTGEYGGFYPLKVQREGGVSCWEWQTTAWSGGQWEARVNIEQTGSASVGGVQVDVNQAMTPDYGQWMPGRLPPTVAPASAPALPEGLPMQFIAAVGADPANPGDNQGDWIWIDGTYVGVAGPDDLTALQSLDIKVIEISFAMHQRLLAATAKAVGPTVTGSLPLTVSATGTLAVGPTG